MSNIIIKPNQQIPDSSYQYTNNAETTIIKGLSLFSTEIELNNAENFPLKSGIVRIGDEYLYYKYRNKNTLHEVIRGIFESRSWEHTSGAKIIAPCLAESINIPNDYLIKIVNAIGTKEDIYAGDNKKETLMAKITYIKNAWLAPHAHFLAFIKSGKSPLIVNFKDFSLGAPYEWIWNFGDGEISSAQHPVHTYKNPGHYDVSLTIYTHYGTSSLFKAKYITVLNDDAIQDIMFYVKKISDQEETHSLSGISGDTFKFIDQTSGKITTRAWDFGDGSENIFVNDVKNISIVHTYKYPGTYLPSLSISNGEETWKKTLSEPITIRPSR